MLFAVGFDRNAGESKSDVYVNGLENTLRVISKRIRRFLYISSSSVYGQIGGETVDETSACEPRTEGGRICLQAEAVVGRFFPPTSAFGKIADPTANILRCAGLYGPGRLLRRISQLRDREPIAGSPLAFLNLVHIDDAVSAVIGCEQHGKPGATYLVSAGESLTRRNYYETLGMDCRCEAAGVYRAGRQHKFVGKVLLECATAAGTAHADSVSDRGSRLATRLECQAANLSNG